MPSIKWDEDLNIGAKSVDDQHKQLIHTINQLHLAVGYGKPGEVIMPLIDRLFEYADAHFHDEELIFGALGYSGALEHKKEHLNFITTLKELKRQFGYSRDFLAIHVKDLLLDWFYNHIRTKDMEYKELLDVQRKARPEASATKTGGV